MNPERGFKPSGLEKSKDHLQIFNELATELRAALEFRRVPASEIGSFPKKSLFLRCLVEEVARFSWGGLTVLVYPAGENKYHAVFRYRPSENFQTFGLETLGLEELKMAVRQKL